MLFLFGPGPRSRAVAGTAEEQDDGVLVQAALADPLAFTMLYDRYLAQIYSYCYVRLDSREAAEDASSEVFLKAFAGLSSYHGGLFAAWLFQIAHNVVINLQSRRRPQVALEFSDLPDPGPTLDEMMISHAESSDLRAALAQLPDEQRTVLEMQAAGWSGAQIATALGKSNAAVRMLRHRAVERLRQLVIGQEVPSCPLPNDRPSCLSNTMTRLLPTKTPCHLPNSILAVPRLSAACSGSCMVSNQPPPSVISYVSNLRRKPD